jgi:predicted CopG family antitoxin
MKQRSFIQGVTLYLTPEMYQTLRQLSDQGKESMSETIRGMIEQCLRTANRPKEKEELKRA